MANGFRPEITGHLEEAQREVRRAIMLYDRHADGRGKALRQIMTELDEAIRRA